MTNQEYQGYNNPRSFYQDPNQYAAQAGGNRNDYQMRNGMWQTQPARARTDEQDDGDGTIQSHGAILSSRQMPSPAVLGPWGLGRRAKIQRWLPLGDRRQTSTDYRDPSVNGPFYPSARPRQRYRMIPMRGRYTRRVFRWWFRR